MPIKNRRSSNIKISPNGFIYVRNAECVRALLLRQRRAKTSPCIRWNPKKTPLHITRFAVFTCVFMFMSPRLFTNKLVSSSMFFRSFGVAALFCCDKSNLIRTLFTLFRFIQFSSVFFLFFRSLSRFALIQVNYFI